jgi:SAM-dependent methyltransferase
LRWGRSGPRYLRMHVPEAIHAPRTWNLVAPGYSAEIVPSFSRFAEDALELANLVPGERVLDVATGPGTLALTAVRAGARVSAIDFSPRMIAELRSRQQKGRLPEIDARIADATSLPYEDGTFDAVFSMFALNLVADRAAAFREIHRVLSPGGRAVVGTPASLEKTAAFPVIREVVGRTLPELDLDYELPLAEPAELRSEMSAAGFSDVQVSTVARSFTFPSVASLWAIAGRAGAPMVVAREAVGEERWSRASEQIVRGLEQRFGPGPQQVELSVNLARASR